MGHKHLDFGPNGVTTISTKLWSADMVAINVSPEYGYVVLAGASMIFVNFWKIMRIGKMRKQLGIKYPQMYSDQHPLFNCYQRAHQNTLEFVPYFYPVLLTAGLRHPIGAAACGFIFSIGRVIYALGYSSGDPEKRIPGALISEFGGLFPLIFMSISFGCGLLGWFGRKKSTLTYVVLTTSFF